MKISKIAAIAAASAMLWLAPGCMSDVNTVENAEMQAKPLQIDSKRIVTDRVLDRNLRVQRVDTSVNESGLLTVQVTAMNVRTGFWNWLYHGDSPYEVAYKFSWLNSKGIELKTPATGIWFERDVLPGETTRFSDVAPSADCRDFRLEIKER